MDRKFYMPDGDEIKINDFIDFYSKCYYLRNSKVVEEEIEKILENGIKKGDVEKIIAWKIGAIDHKECQGSGEFVINRDDKGNVKDRYHSIDCKEIWEKIKDIELNSDEKNIYEKLTQADIKGLGPVYLITLVYFITKGKMPIYDKYADVALQAIKDGKAPGSEIEYEELPQKGTKAYRELLLEGVDNPYRQYVKRLNEVFEGKDIINRDIDRALWEYGHLFRIKVKKR